MIAVVCLVLGGCTDADWDNAFSYLPMEHQQQTADASPESATLAATGTPAPTSIAKAAQTGPAPIDARVSAQQSEPATVEVQPASPPTASQPEAVARQATEVAATADAHCRVVATQRATDVGYMGLDEDQQKQEYELTYANCVAWDKAHGYGP